MIMAQKKKNFTTFLIIVASLLIGFLIGYIVGYRYGTKLKIENIGLAMSQQFQRQPLRGEFSSRAMEITRELNCICGCKMELLPCTCDEPRGSKEIKQFVQVLVDEGLSKTEVIGRVIERYGQAILIKKNA